MNFGALFTKKKEGIYTIERADIDLTKEMFGLIVKMEEVLRSLMEHVRTGNVLLKDADMAELENTLLLLKSKAEMLKIDVKRIMEMEIANKDFITIHDDAFLQDKYNKLDVMTWALEEVIDALKEKPTAPDLKKELLMYIYAKVNQVIDSLNDVVTDDRQLEPIYSRLTVV